MGAGAGAGTGAGAGNAAAAVEQAPHASEAQATESPASEAAAVAVTAAGSMQGGISPSQWEEAMQRIKARSVVLQAYLVAAVGYSLDQGVLSIHFDPVKGKFHKERCEERDNLQTISETISEIVGSQVAVECVFTGEAGLEDPVDQAIRFFGRDIVKLV